MATEISYNGYDLQNANIVTSQAQSFEKSMREVNIQGFITRDGGKLLSTQYNPKQIILGGYIKGTSKEDLESRIDEIKEQLQEPTEANLLIAYRDGNRRFACTCKEVNFNRQNYTIDYVEWNATFIVSDPPFGQNTASTTLNQFGLTNTFVNTATGEHTGSLDFAGTIAGHPYITFRFHAANDVSKIKFGNTNDDGFVTETVMNVDLNDGDLIVIDVENGEITCNGDAIDYEGGFPNFTLSGNAYTIKIIGKSYNLDVKFTYYALWL